MPLATIASAVCSISHSSTLQPKAFQSLKPIGGLNANPLANAPAGAEPATCTARAPSTASDAAVRMATRLQIIALLDKSPRTSRKPDGFGKIRQAPEMA